WTQNISADVKRAREAALIAAEQDLEELHVEVRHSSPRYASLEYPEPVSLDRIQRALLDDRTALVEYLLGDKRSLIWVVTANTCKTVVLPPRNELEEQVAAYRKVLSEPVSALTVNQSLIAINRAGLKLYRSLFQPIQNA